MRKSRMRTFLCASLSAASLLVSIPFPTYAATATTSEAQQLKFQAKTDGIKESERKFTTTIEFESYDNADDGFNDLTKTIIIGDTTFELSQIANLKMTDSKTPERRTMEVVSDTFLKNQEEEAYAPQEIITQDGVTWKLTSKELEDAEIPDVVRDAVTTRQYKDVEPGIAIPKTIDYTYENRDTKEKVDTTLPLTDETDSSWRWIEFSFPITITDYDAEVLDLNGVEIPAGEPLINYKTEFLKMLGLDPDYYQINTIDWDGGAYEENGSLIRKASGTGQKRVRDVDAVYSGKVTLPHRDGAVWKSVYTEELGKNNSAVYTYTANALYVSTAQQTWWQKIAGIITAVYEAVIGAIQEHPILAAIPILLLAAAITMVIAKRRKMCIYDRKHECQNKRDCENCPYYLSLQAETADERYTEK